MYSVENIWEKNTKFFREVDSKLLSGLQFYLET